MEVTLTTPESITKWGVTMIQKMVDKSIPDLAVVPDSASIVVTVKADTGTTRDFSVTGADALALLSQLNTADNTTVSEEQKILNWLQINGFLAAGTVGGTPL